MNTPYGIINEQDYYRTVYGGWLGKNIGGTLGAPVEGVKELLTLDFYPELPDGPLENDDLDLQLVWLHALEQYGPGLTARQLGQEWLDHIFFPFDEYGYALTNLRRGLKPPLAGIFNNPFNHCMGSPIRSEIWAMAAPGQPALAARYAYEDAIVDHAGGEGVYGEMFFAALESAIFFEKDRDALIAIGLQFIPPDCRTARAVKDLLRWHAEGHGWIETRALILEHHGSPNFTDTPQNIAFTLLGWLYGTDFEDAILKAVNCGYDTDCTAATLAAILGMILGPEQLPGKWVNPVGNRVVVSPPIHGFPYPRTLDELTRRTMAVGRRVLAEAGAAVMIDPELPTRLVQETETPETIKALWTRSPYVDTRLLPEGTQRHAFFRLEIRYDANDPSIGESGSKPLSFTLTNTSTSAANCRLELILPSGWQGPNSIAIRLDAGAAYEWETTVSAASELSQPAYELGLRVTRLHDGAPWTSYAVSFVLVRAFGWQLTGPLEATGRSCWVAGNRLLPDRLLGSTEPGWYRAITVLHNPAERQISLVVAAPGPVRLTLNGTTVIDSPGAADWLPAYHRGAEGQRIELALPAGQHCMEVEAFRGAEPLDLYVLFVAPAVTGEPGPWYAVNELLLSPPLS